HLVRSDSWYSLPFAVGQADRNFSFTPPQQWRAESCQRKVNFLKRVFESTKKPGYTRQSGSDMKR
ncbi:hypothetical protein HMPREF1987_01946, partial [Peptostreptococcaceae bacterium oral taxon 113 str. W5053]